MLRNRYRTSWSHKNFHLTLYLSVVLFILTSVLIKQTGFEIQFKLKAYAEEDLASPLPKPTPATLLPSLEPLPPSQDWDSFIKKVYTIAPIYDFPVKVAIAQAALESNRGNSSLAKNKRNFYGLNAVDWDPYDSAWTFDNFEQCIIKYMQLIKDKYPEAYQNRKNPELMIEMIKEGGYATDPHYVAKIMSTPEWKLTP